MNYSIIMPVFNREDLTRKCLETLSPTLAGAGEGEVIVVDNGSKPATADVLAAFPWVRVIRNECNLGFAAACNQAAQVAQGHYVVHLNNDTIALAGWLARLLARFDEGDVGIVGARLLFPNDTIQHAGVMLSPFRLGPEGFGPFHFMWGSPKDSRAVLQPRDFEVVTGACMVTPRDLYLELGGFDETFWNGFEDVDYCLKVRARGLRVVYEPSAVLYHYESQSGVQRKRRLMHNIRELGARWAARVAPDHNRCVDLTGQVRREQFIHRQRSFVMMPLPSTVAILHGPQPDLAFMERVNGGYLRPAELLWAGEGPAPSGTTGLSDPLTGARAVTELRSDRYVAFIDTRSSLEPQWLLELVDTIEVARELVAATVLPATDENEWAPMTADAQCTLVKLAVIPQHVRIDPQFSTVSGALADWLTRCVAIGRSVRRTHRATARIGTVPDDLAFFNQYGMSIADAVRPSPQRMEQICGVAELRRELTTIVMLSWNAPEFTEMAVASIKAHTVGPFEIILIDNGSSATTVERLKALTGVRIIYNPKNMGFAHGCNQGLAAAAGSHVVLLNNDVVVTDGWLDALLDAHRRDGVVGISAPRSNYVAGHQQVPDAAYSDIANMHEYARERGAQLRGRTYHTDRVIGFCMCISRAVIDEVGGIDTRYGVGNFEDDDYCLRVRAAGYEIVVCEDSFIHHFGNVTFKANNVDWMSQMQANWRVFADRWKFPGPYPTNGYDPRPVILRGFVRERDYVALPVLDGPALDATVADPIAGASSAERAYAVAILASVRDESDWSRVAPVIGNYARAITAAQSVVFAIAATGELDAVTLGKRIERALSKAGIDPESSPDIEVSDVKDTDSWRERFARAQCLSLSTPELAGIAPLPERSRSGIARLVRTMAS